MKVFFSKSARKNYEKWQKSKRDIIDELIEDIEENGFLCCKGKPERLKHHKDPALFSRRIDKSNRLIYRSCNESDLFIVACKGHYLDK